MLYDQAQLVSSYIDGIRSRRNRFYADIARRHCDYVLRDMTGPDGVSIPPKMLIAGRRRQVLRLTRDEMKKILSDRVDAFVSLWRDADGNWEHGLNVLTSRRHLKRRNLRTNVRNCFTAGRSVSARIARKNPDGMERFDDFRTERCTQR